MPDIETLQKIEQQHYFELSKRVDNLNKKFEAGKDQKKNNIYTALKELIDVVGTMANKIDSQTDELLIERKRNNELEKKFNEVLLHE